MNDTAPVLGTVLGTDYTVTGLAAGETLATAPTLAYAATPVMTAASTATIVPSGAAVPDGGNYNDIVYNNGTLTISNRPSSGGGSSSPTYSITNGTTSTANGSVTLDKTNATSGSTVKITPKANDGYEVDTVTVKDASGKAVTVTKNTDGTFRFTMPSGKVTVTATFKKASSAWVNPFTDVKEGDTFHEAIRYANENSLFEGTSATTFSPNAPMTRAMLWTVLGRLDGQSLTGSGVFDRAKAWATGSGVTDGSNPSGLISRQQLITILWRYAQLAAK